MISHFFSNIKIRVAVADDQALWGGTKPSCVGWVYHIISLLRLLFTEVIYVM